MNALPTLSGEVIFPCDFIASAGTVLRIDLQDVTRADAASVTVASLVVHVTRRVHAGDRVPFVLATLRLDARKRYAVRAHADCSGSGTIQAGDLVSTQSHPVLTRGFPAWASIVLSPV